MPRIVRAPAVTGRPYRASASGGNGTPPQESEAERFTRLESVIETMQHELDVQLQRIADLQGQLDRVIADRPLPKR